VSWYPFVANWILQVKCSSRLWHGNLITTAEILLMLMDFSVLAEDLYMVMLRTSAANGNVSFFYRGVLLLDWCPRLELTMGRLHRLKAFVTWGRLLWHLPNNWEKTMENLSWCSWKVPHTHTHIHSLLCVSGYLFKDSLDMTADFQSLLPKSSGDSGQLSFSVSAYYVGCAVLLSSSLQFYLTMHNGMAKLAIFFVPLALIQTIVIYLVTTW
jgi:hypothetical protein